MSSVVVYAYGCGQPISGLEHALAEHARCARFWDALVAIDHDIERQMLARARADDPELDAVMTRIAELSAHLAEHPDDKSARAERRRLFREQRQRLAAWRKSARDVVREFERERIARVTDARKAVTTNASGDDRIYWGNSNRLLQSYDTGRRIARQRGRMLRPYDPERDDGVLMVQIQCTRSGLGAAPVELMDGTFSHLQITQPDARGQSQVSMRVDAAGHHIVLPVWLHRPMPPQSRVKAAQLVWLRHADRFRWQLCLTVDMQQEFRVRTASSGVPVEFDWQDQGELEVMRIGEKIWRLPMHWMQRLDVIERMQGQLDDALNEARRRWGEHEVMGPLLALPRWRDRIHEIALARPRLTEDMIRWWVHARRLWLAIPGARAHALGHRREIYRQWAREVASSYAAIQLPDLDIARIAREKRGEPENAARHRAAVHTLRQEIIWQCTKAGTPVFDASGAVLNAPKDGESKAWARRKAAKAQRSQMVAQAVDSA